MSDSPVPAALHSSQGAWVQLLLALTRREILARYQGALFGRLWLLLSPFLLLAVYTFVFGQVLKSRWGAEQSTASFALTLFAGLLLHGMLADSLSRAVTVMHNHRNQVKKLVFPLELLPLSLALSALSNAVIGFLVLLLLMPWLGQPLGWSILYLPLVLLPFVLCVCGLSWIIAVFGAYFRDTSQFIQFLLVLLLFLSPVFYPVSALPEALRPYLLLNPLSVPVEAVRACLFGMPMPPMGVQLAYAVIACLLAVLGWLWFRRMKDGFADVL
ncbi:ABC transporter permease [Pseudomonas citronellolis]|uniref:ABC transporter permease n=1 Tax=Pseudomonas citronellolis TaxID=53408 RepID=UPI0007186B12|nr:ABC transporter permease [Pseudomonas citronellolis]KRV81734.1 ABC transporter permease [Pseudomonas citronellolis]KRW77251.1 ABC transporter permease [Pseudomonas citronellolis]WRT83153.1 ABC transporter permease [Pseudomonas citronellolis]